MNNVTVQSGVLTETIWPNASIVRDAILVLGGSLLIALSAQLVIPLPFSPVPITGQTFAVLLLAAVYGRKRGLATVVTYLMLGVMGLAVFAPGGAVGAARLAGPTGGYLMGYLPAAFIVGWLSERGWDRRSWSTALMMIIGNAIIYLTGALWLQGFVGSAVLETGVLPFIPGDLLKIALAMLILPVAWRFVGTPRGTGSA